MTTRSLRQRRVWRGSAGPGLTARGRTTAPGIGSVRKGGWFRLASEPAANRLDIRGWSEQDFVVSTAAVRKLIALASELSEDERRVVVDAIAPKESVASLAEEWAAEIAHRAERVKSGQSQGKPADEVFDRIESKLKAR